MKKRYFILLLLFLILFMPFSLCYTAEKQAWIEAEGEAAMGDTDTPNEVKDRAKRDAQKKAVEQAVGVFIKGHTLVSNGQLAEDLIYAKIRGKIEKIEVLTEGWDEKDRNTYRVRLRALVEALYSEDKGHISLKVSLSKSDLKAGEETKVFYQSDSDCYVYIFSIANDGSVTLLLPNSIHRENLAKASVAYQFPPPDSPIRLIAGFLPKHVKPVANETIKIIATKKQEDIITLGFKEGMLKVYDAKSTGMISDLIKRLNQIEPSDWTEATTGYRIIR